MKKYEKEWKRMKKYEKVWKRMKKDEKVWKRMKKNKKTFTSMSHFSFSSPIHQKSEFWKINTPDNFLTRILQKKCERLVTPLNRTHHTSCCVDWASCAPSSSCAPSAPPYSWTPSHSTGRPTHPTSLAAGPATKPNPRFIIKFREKMSTPLIH